VSGIRCLFEPLDPGSGIGFFRIPDLGLTFRAQKALAALVAISGKKVSISGLPLHMALVIDFAPFKSMQLLTGAE
jgi:hypothetical protein